MSLTRDIRLTADHIVAIRDNSRSRRREMEKRLERNPYDGKPGMKSSVIRERDLHAEVAEIMETARKQIARQVAETLR